MLKRRRCLLKKRLRRLTWRACVEPLDGDRPPHLLTALRCLSIFFVAHVIAHRSRVTLLLFLVLFHPFLGHRNQQIRKECFSGFLGGLRCHAVALGGERPSPVQHPPSASCRHRRKISGWPTHKTRTASGRVLCFFLQGGRGGADLGREDRSVVIDCFQLFCPDLSQLVFPDLSSCSVDDNYSPL